MRWCPKCGKMLPEAEFSRGAPRDAFGDKPCDLCAAEARRRDLDRMIERLRGLRLQREAREREMTSRMNAAAGK